MTRTKKDEQPLEAEAHEENAHAEESSDIVVPAESVTSGQLTDAELADEQRTEQIVDSESVTAAEEAAVHADTHSAKLAAGQRVGADAKPVKPPVVGKPKHQSDRYKAALSSVDRTRRYPLEQAVQLAAKAAYANFDGTLSLAARIQPGKKGESESIRGLIQLPHGSGKAVQAAILTEELIEEIAKSGKAAAEVLIATPALMPKVATVAKILGPQGKMPSPKAGTVSDKPEEVLAALQSGRVEYRADASGIVHQPIGKVSWPVENVVQNARAVLGALGSYQLLSVTISATMGPGVRVDLSE